MKSRKTFSKYLLVAGVLSASIFLTSCTASSTEPISAAPSASSTSRSAAIDTLYLELCIENQSGGPMSFRYFGEEIKILSGDLSGEVPKNGTTCATGTTARSLTHQGFNLFGSLVAEIKLPELENSATMVMRFLPSDGWSLLLNDREWSAPMWHMFDNGYVEDAGYRMDVTYFRNKIIYTKDKSKLIDHQVDSYKVVVY